MSADASDHRRWELPAVCALCVLTLLPFVNKAYHIDDPLFLWTARQIMRNPLDFYGFSVNWQGFDEPMWAEMKNPPGVGYYVALVGSVAGFSEAVMHLAFIPFAVAVVAGTYLLARQLGGSGLIAALVVLASPIFLVSATNVMSDVVMLAGWTWAVLLWVRGVEEERAGFILASGTLVALAFLAKYPAMNLVPLLLAYGLIRRRMVIWQIAAIALVVIMIVVYQLMTARMYGRGLLSDAGSYVTTHGPWRMLGKNVLIALAFMGGGILPASLIIASGSKRSRLMLPVGAAVIATVIAFVLGVAHDCATAIQLGVMACGGGAIIMLAARASYRQRDSVNSLLLLWIVGVFAYATMINTTVNARTILMMIPAAAVLVARGESVLRVHRPVMIILLVVSFAIAIVVAVADYRLAGGSRTVAAEARQLQASDGRRTWFTGHWGFQWYMQPFAKPVGSGSGTMAPGDLLLMNLKTSDPSRLPQGAALELERREISGVPGISMSGFYTDVHGPLPFRIGETERARFAIIEITRPLRLTTKPAD